MIRLLYVNEISEIGGAERALLTLVEGLDPECYHPLVACPDGPLAHELERLGIQHIEFSFRARKLKTGIPLKSAVRIVNPLALLQKILEGVTLSALVRKHEVDIIQSFSLSAHIAGIVAARLRCKPIIWHIHTFFPTWLYRFWLPDRLVFVSHSALISAFGDNSPPTASVISNAQDFANLDPGHIEYRNLRRDLELDSQQPVVLVLSRISPEKTLHNILNAWPHVLAQHPTARLIIAGDSADEQHRYRQELNELVSKLAIEDSTLFVGWRNDVADLLFASDVLAFPSENDTAGRSILEAMAMCKPVVALRAGGVPELIVDGETGLLIEPGDVDGFGRTIAKLLGDAVMRQKIGSTARSYVLEHFQVDEHIHKFEELYTTISPANL